MNQGNELFLAALLSDVGLLKEYGDNNTPHWEASLQFWGNVPKVRELGVDTELVESLIKHHHGVPESRLENILHHANVLVLGTDEENPNSEEWKCASPPAFVSIFSKLHPEIQTPELSFLPPDKLNPQCLLFPKKDIQHESLAASYVSLWEELMSEVGNLPSGNMWSLQTSLVALLMKYLSRVPATKTIGATSLMSQEDVSLSERCRLTAALAHCMYSPDKAIDEWGQDDSHDVAQLVSGDLSGIQAFIYTITSEGVAKGLRGRSLYLQLLSEAIARRVLTSLGLPDVNLLYNSGGNFYILAQPGADTELESIQEEINAIMLKHHHGDIYCALAGVGLTRDDFLQGNNLAKRWASLTQDLSSKKRRKFANMAVSEYDKLFSCATMPVDNLCVICTQEEAIDPEGIGSFCKSFAELGDDLGRADYLIQGDVTSTEVEVQEEGEEHTIYLSILGDLGSIYRLTDKTEVEGRVQLFAARGATNIRVFRLNNTCFLSDLKLSPTVGRGFRLLGNVNPWKVESTAPKPQIADFASLANSSRGVQRWGVLRMDIDNLGTLFKEGFKPPEERCQDDTRRNQQKPISSTSLARVTSLSFQISLFFEGYLNEIVGKYNQFDPNHPDDTAKSDHLYIIYSGGDDLFIVGSWDVIIKVASDIRTQFREYVCQNPKVTISGGISLHKKKYPLYKAAEKADNALDDAKEHVNPNKEKEKCPTHKTAETTQDAPKDAKKCVPNKKAEEKPKNALGMFDTAFHWDEEFPKVKALKKDILALVDEGKNSKKLSKGFLHRLADIYRLYFEGQDGLLANINDAKSIDQVGSHLKHHRWKWRSAYAFAREDELFKEELEALRDKLVKENLIQYLNVAVRWVELLLREEYND